MFSVISLLMVLAELIGTGAAVSGMLGEGESAKLFYHMFVYGSPASLAMDFFSATGGVSETSKYVLFMMGFHVVKYGSFVMAQLREGPSGSLTTAIILEALYLAGSAYMVI